RSTGPRWGRSPDGRAERELPAWHENPPGGARGRPRGPLAGRGERIRPPGPGVRHVRLLGRGLEPSRVGPTDAEPDQPGDVDRAEPQPRTGSARAWGGQQ